MLTNSNVHTISKKKANFVVFILLVVLLVSFGMYQEYSKGRLAQTKQNLENDVTVLRKNAYEYDVPDPTKMYIQLYPGERPSEVVVSLYVPSRLENVPMRETISTFDAIQGRFSDISYSKLSSGYWVGRIATKKWEKDARFLNTKEENSSIVFSVRSNLGLLSRSLRGLSEKELDTIQLIFVQPVKGSLNKTELPLEVAEVTDDTCAIFLEWQVSDEASDLVTTRNTTFAAYELRIGNRHSHEPEY